MLKSWSQSYGKWPAHAQSKLANLMFTVDPARRIQAFGRSIISAGAHPGHAATGLQMVGPRMENSRLGKLLMAGRNALLAQSAEHGPGHPACGHPRQR